MPVLVMMCVEDGYTEVIRDYADRELHGAEMSRGITCSGGGLSDRGVPGRRLHVDDDPLLSSAIGRAGGGERTVRVVLSARRAGVGRLGVSTHRLGCQTYSFRVDESESPLNESSKVPLIRLAHHPART